MRDNHLYRLLCTICATLLFLLRRYCGNSPEISQSAKLEAARSFYEDLIDKARNIPDWDQTDEEIL